MRFLNAKQVDEFMASIGKPPIRRARRASITTLRGLDTSGWDDGWGAENYSQGDPNVFIHKETGYNDRVIFNPQFITGTGASVPLTSNPQLAAAVDSTTTETTTIQQTPISKVQLEGPLPGSNAFQVNYLTCNPTVFQNQFYLAANYRRGLLLLQNQAASANLWINFGNAAAVGSGLLLTPGLGLLLDVKVPNNAVYGIYSSTAVGFILEGTETASTPIG